MIERKDLASWMDGHADAEGYVRGSAIGLPPSGPGSPAPFLRRVLTLFIDWGLCLGVSWIVAGGDALLTSALFIALNVTMLTLWGATPGQLLLRLRIVPVRGQTPMLLRALLRTALMLLVLPAAFWNRDLQPLHDAVAGTAVVRL